MNHRQNICADLALVVGAEERENRAVNITNRDDKASQSRGEYPKTKGSRNVVNALRYRRTTSIITHYIGDERDLYYFTFWSRAAGQHGVGQRGAYQVRELDEAYHGMDSPIWGYL